MKSNIPITKTPDLSFLPLHLAELNKPRRIKIRKSPGIFRKISKFLSNLPKNIISGLAATIMGIINPIINLVDSFLWYFTGLSPWFIIPFFAFLIIFGPALAVQWFSL